MAKCPICNDSGKRPGSDYLDCGCTASAERAELNTFAEDQISTSNPEERDWLIYTRAKALGRASALAELHPLWLAEKERADRAEARIAELEAQLAAASPSDTNKLREAIEALDELADEAEANGNTSAWTNSMVAKVRSAMAAKGYSKQCRKDVITLMVDTKIEAPASPQPVAKVLTDTRIEEIAIDTGGSGWIIVFARAIEAEILAASTPTTLTEKKECQ